MFNIVVFGRIAERKKKKQNKQDFSNFVASVT